MEKYRLLIESNKQTQKKSWISKTGISNKLIDKAFLKDLQKTSFCG